MKKTTQPSKFVKKRTIEIKQREKNTEALSVEELKKYISECEERYHASFKTDSCREIMASYYEWQAAKKRYYVAIGVCRPVEENPMDQFVEDDEENDNLDGDFNSLI
jgi:hypothetical protein